MRQQGFFLTLDEILVLLRNNQRSVVNTDETCIEFGGDSAASLVKDFSNSSLVQTKSKSYASAGPSVGMAYGHSRLIDAIDRVKNSFNL